MNADNRRGVFLKLFKKDSRGIAFSLDLLLALIPITIILGLVAASMGNIMYDTQDVVYRSSMERSAQDTSNALLKTSGNPYNWETLGASQLKSVGLAKYDTSNKLPLEYVLSTDKVGAIAPANVQSMLGSQYSYQLLITTLKTGNIVRNLNSVDNTYTKETATDVVAVERIVSISEFDIVAELKNIRLTKSPITLTEFFSTNRAYLDAFDYYVYVDNSDKVSSGWVEINGVSGNSRVVPPNAFPSTPPLVRYIDPVVQQLKNGETLQENRIQTLLAGSPGDTMDVYVIRVPKGTPSQDINPENIHGVKAKYVLYVWTR
ncbi:MAG: hypothetical protein PHQ17_08435 [Methanobacterium sp.]|nr:hypothetical protein [Methanobacterium sp.]